MPTWSLDLYNLGGTAVAIGTEFRRVVARRRLNEPGAIEIELPWDATRSDWAVGERDIEVVRDGTTWWLGRLWHLRGNARARTVGAQGQGLLSVLRRRIVTSDLQYTSIAQHQIAWNLIAHTQAQADGGLGLTQGTHTGSTTNRSRNYCANEAPNVGAAIADLAFLEDGFDFDIDPTDRTFDTWSPQKKTARAITLTGAEELTLEWEEDAFEAASYVTAVGDGDCGPPVVEVTDATAASRFGRLHEATDADVDNTSEVTEAANEELRVRKDGLFRARVAFDDDYGPAFGSYELGDTLTVNVAHGMATFNRTFRITEIALELEWPDLAFWELELDGAVD